MLSVIVIASGVMVWHANPHKHPFQEHNKTDMADAGGADEYSHLDLDVRNYTLRELLNLLQLPEGFTDRDLRRAMRHVAQLHPDKSNAPPEVYRLFYQAHMICRQLLSARTQGSLSALVREDYDTPEGRTIAADMSQREDFQTWFNESFEEFHNTLPEQTQGHSEWLSEEVAEGPRVRSQAQMAAEMAKRRKEAAKREVVLAGGPMAANHGGGTMLIASEEAPLTMTGGMVDDIAFGDLKQSYENSIIPVAEIDGMGVDGGTWAPPRAQTLAEMQRERAAMDAESASGWRSYEEEIAAHDEAQRKLLRESTDARMFSLQQEDQGHLDAHQRWRAATLGLTYGRR
jgi:hypothetical protein